MHGILEFPFITAYNIASFCKGLNVVGLFLIGLFTISFFILYDMFDLSLF